MLTPANVIEVATVAHTARVRNGRRGPGRSTKKDDMSAFLSAEFSASVRSPQTPHRHRWHSRCVPPQTQGSSECSAHDAFGIGGHELVNPDDDDVSVQRDGPLTPEPSPPLA